MSSFVSRVETEDPAHGVDGMERRKGKSGFAARQPDSTKRNALRDGYCYYYMYAGGSDDHPSPSAHKGRCKTLPRPWENDDEQAENKDETRPDM